MAADGGNELLPVPVATTDDDAEAAASTRTVLPEVAVAFRTASVPACSSEGDEPVLVSEIVGVVVAVVLDEMVVEPRFPPLEETELTGDSWLGPPSAAVDPVDPVVPPEPITPGVVTEL